MSPGLSAPHVCADPDHRSRDIVAEDERERVRQDLPELAEPDLLIEDVDPGGAHAHEHVGAPDARLGHLDLLERTLVCRNGERLHISVVLLFVSGATRSAPK